MAADRPRAAPDGGDAVLDGVPAWQKQDDRALINSVRDALEAVLAASVEFASVRAKPAAAAVAAPALAPVPDAWPALPSSATARGPNKADVLPPTGRRVKPTHIAGAPTVASAAFQSAATTSFAAVPAVGRPKQGGARGPRPPAQSIISAEERAQWMAARQGAVSASTGAPKRPKEARPLAAAPLAAAAAAPAAASPWPAPAAASPLPAPAAAAPWPAPAAASPLPAPAAASPLPAPAAASPLPAPAPSSETQAKSPFPWESEPDASAHALADAYAAALLGSPNASFADEMSLVLGALSVRQVGDAQADRLRNLVVGKFSLSLPSFASSVVLAARRCAPLLAAVDARLAAALSALPSLQFTAPEAPLPAPPSSRQPLAATATLLVTLTSTEQDVRGPKTKAYLNLSKARDAFVTLLRTSDGSYPVGKDHEKAFIGKAQQLVGELLDENMEPFSEWMCDTMLLRCVTHSLHMVYPSLSPFPSDFSKMQLMDRALERRAPGAAPLPSQGLFRALERIFADFVRAADSYRLNTCLLAQIQRRIQGLHDSTAVRDRAAGTARSDATAERILALRLLAKIYGFIQGGPFWTHSAPVLRLPLAASAPTVNGLSPERVLAAHEQAESTLFCLPWLCEYLRALYYGREPSAALDDDPLCAALASKHAAVCSALAKADASATTTRATMVARLLLDELAEALAIRPRASPFTLTAETKLALAAWGLAGLPHMFTGVDALPEVFSERVVGLLCPSVAEVVAALEQPRQAARPAEQARKPSKRVNPTPTTAPTGASVPRSELETWFVWQHASLKEMAEFVVERTANGAMDAVLEAPALLDDALFTAALLQSDSDAPRAAAELLVERCFATAAARAAEAVRALAPASTAAMVMENLLAYVARSLRTALQDAAVKIVHSEAENWRRKIAKRGNGGAPAAVAAPSPSEAALSAVERATPGFAAEVAALDRGDLPGLAAFSPVSLAAAIGALCGGTADTDGDTDKRVARAAAALARVAAALPPRVLTRMAVEAARTAAESEHDEAALAHVESRLRVAMLALQRSAPLSAADIVNALGQGRAAELAQRVL